VSIKNPRLQKLTCSTFKKEIKNKNKTEKREKIHRYSSTPHPPCGIVVAKTKVC
jgi:hypothetical protein